MSETMTLRNDPVIIFEVDNSSDLHIKSKFLRHMDTLRAMDKLSSTLVQGIGCYKHVLNDCYILGRTDYLEHVAKHGFTDNQESVLQVQDDHKGRMIASLLVPDLQGHIESLGQLYSYTNLPWDADGWTYRPDLGVYFTDLSPEKSVKGFLHSLL